MSGGMRSSADLDSFVPTAGDDHRVQDVRAEAHA
jgi:hypothetical protein